MNDWKSKLRDAGAAREAEASAEDVQRIRNTVSVAARETERQRVFAWSRPFVLTTAALSVTCAVTLVALQQSMAEMRRAPSPVIVSDSDPQSEPGPVVQKQQLHFATPGGTRIIWVFDADFDVKGTLP